MHPTAKAARIAGTIYLSMVFTAPFCLIYVPSKLIVRGNAAEPPITSWLTKPCFGCRSLAISLVR